MTEPSENRSGRSRLRGWAVLLSVVAFVYLFAVYLGPELQHHIYGMDEIVRVIEENGIDAGAYYYTEIDGAEEGQRYLEQTLRFMAPEHHGLTLPVLAGIVICLLILYVGLRSAPR